MFVAIDQMRPHVVFYDLSHEPSHTTARAGDQMHNLLAPRLGFESPFNPFHLAANASHAGQQFLLIANGMTHALPYHSPLSYRIRPRSTLYRESSTPPVFGSLTISLLEG